MSQVSRVAVAVITVEDSSNNEMIMTTSSCSFRITILLSICKRSGSLALYV